MTDKILPRIEDWQNRPLDEVYPILYIDAIHYSVRDNGVIRKLAAYVILGINTEEKKEVLTISVGDNESAKYWLSIMNELKNRGVKDVLIICADGLTGIKEAIAAAFPKTEYQRCIVHQVRNTLKYVPDKDRKAFATDLKTIYQATDEKKALAALERVTEKWTPKYPNSMKRWKDNWDAISPIFKFSTTVRTVIYTTNAIESLNSTYRKLNRQRSVFPSDTALLKALYLATLEVGKHGVSIVSQDGTADTTLRITPQPEEEEETEKTTTGKTTKTSAKTAKTNKTSTKTAKTTKKIKSPNTGDISRPLTAMIGAAMLLTPFALCALEGYFLNLVNMY